MGDVLKIIIERIVVFTKKLCDFLYVSIVTPCPETVPVRVKNYNEQGYLLMTVLVIAMLIASIFGSITFYHAKLTQQNRFFAYGQQAARYANAAHYYAQMEQEEFIYSGGILGHDYRLTGDGSKTISLADMEGADLINSATIEGFPVGTNLEIWGVYGPVNMPVGAQGATAYVLVDFNFGATDIAPSLLNALKAGASSEGLMIGYPPNPAIVTPLSECVTGTGVVTPSGYVSWGKGPFDCMQQSIGSGSVDSVFGGGTAAGMDYYDFIAPGWIVAQSKQDLRALFRIPQPGLPMAQTMQTDIQMTDTLGVPWDVGALGANSINELDTTTMTATSDVTVANDTFVELTTTLTGAGAFDTLQVGTTAGDLNVSNDLGVDPVITITGNPGPVAPFVPAVTVGSDLIVSSGAPDALDLTTQRVLDVNSLNTNPAGVNPDSHTITVQNTMTGDTDTGGNLEVNLQGGVNTMEVSTFDATTGNVRFDVQTGDLQAGAISFTANDLVADEDMGIQRIDINNGPLEIRYLTGGDAAAPSNDRVIADSVEVTDSDPLNAPDYGNITGISRMNMNHECYGACPDFEEPPDDDPFE